MKHILAVILTAYFRAKYGAAYTLHDLNARELYAVQSRDLECDLG